eukprot:gnl/MRDRNA2_/MRDRNA2_23954_c0_seq1.p1 gnl/MRDRNA2_/MRDRNA2_23954_c0~~gnl/MRDRNA2_/MRDRNA2_23954_c0_seq1.p1  ORF type:complete len:501 (+),score=110.47 gnl/MRDRNA2_/MRDRNA2_23954_c0_seq1:106-1608(+)
MVEIVATLQSIVHPTLSGHVQRIRGGTGWVVHGLAFEHKDGVRVGQFLEDDGSPIDLLGDEGLDRRTCSAAEGWIDLQDGERIVRVHGKNSNIGYLCGMINLHTNLGRDISFVGEKPDKYSSAFDISAPDGKEIDECVFEGGTMKTVKVVSTNIWGSKTNAELRSVREKVEAAAIATCHLHLCTVQHLRIKEQKHAWFLARELGVANKLGSTLDVLKQNVIESMDLPRYWDMSVMERQDMKGAKTFQHNADDFTNLFAIVPVPEAELEKLQSLFDASFCKKYHKDRKGAKVPDKLLVQDANYIQNAQNWCEYKIKEKAIREEISQLRANGTQILDSVDHLKTRSFVFTSPGHWSDSNADAEELDARTNTVFLFHGTSKAGAAGITKEDFYISKAGKNAGAVYGSGIYLAEACTKSDEYSEADGDGLRYMLVCRVVLGNMHYTEEYFPKDVDSLVDSCVKGEYHSVLADREKARNTFREFIVYDEDQVYPEFLVRYKRCYT